MRKCESANSKTYEVQNKMRKYFAADTKLVTDWFDMFIHIVRAQRQFTEVDLSLKAHVTLK